MRKMLMVTLFTLATLPWALAQQPGGMQAPGSQSPGSQVPGESQSQSATPGNAGQDATQPGAQGQMANTQITEGCLGGSNPNYTITDKTGTTYKLNIPPNADASPLASHIGESVQVAGEVKDAGKPNKASIDVSKIGKGMGNCPAGSSGAPPKK